MTSQFLELQEDNLVITSEINIRFQKCMNTLGEKKAFQMFSHGISTLLEDMEDSATVFQRKSESGKGITLTELENKHNEI